MKEIYKQLSENEFIVKYDKDYFGLVKLSKPFEGLTFKQSLERLLDKENKIDGKIDYLLEDKKYIQNNLTKDIVFAGIISIIVFFVSMKLTGIILPLTKVIDASELLGFQTMVSMATASLSIIGAQEILKKYDNNIFKFYKKRKVQRQIEYELEKTRNKYDKIIEMRNILGIESKTISTEQVLKLIKESNQSNNQPEPSRYSYSFSNNQEKESEPNYGQEFPKKPKR